MKTINYSKQQGFTLVEIAIVMVIIGLLLGAVLKGQNLINSAKVRSMADQNSGVQAAYYGFIDRYRSVPGDMSGGRACEAIGANQFGVASCASFSIGGDTDGDNGRLDMDDYGEASALWAHLSAANFIVGSYPGGASSDATYAVEGIAPKNPFEGNVLLWRTTGYQSSATSGERLGFVVGQSTPVSVMLELDEKIDDGRPQTGVLRIATNGTEADQGSSSCITTSTVDSTSITSNIWNVTGDSQDCNAIYLY